MSGRVLPNERTYDIRQLLWQDTVSDAARQAEVALKALREAKDKEGQRRAAEALDQAMTKLREQLR